MFRRCTGKAPEEGELALLAERLEQLRTRYLASPAEAARLVQVGAAPRNESIPDPELAAWTLIASALLNLDACLNRS